MGVFLFGRIWHQALFTTKLVFSRAFSLPFVSTTVVRDPNETIDLATFAFGCLVYTLKLDSIHTKSLIPTCLYMSLWEFSLMQVIGSVSYLCPEMGTFGLCWRAWAFFTHWAAATFTPFKKKFLGTCLS